jgi:hypothetical protein
VSRVVVNPVLTYWHELHPQYSRRWQVSKWKGDTNGRLDCGEFIQLKGTLPNDTTWFQVETKTTTIKLLKKPALTDTFFLEYWGDNPKGTKGFCADTLVQQPVSTYWHLVRGVAPDTFCEVWHCSSWVDNGNGYLDSCDQVDFYKVRPLLPDQPPVYMGDYHVIRVATDLILIKTGTSPTPTMTQWGLIILVVLLIASAVFVALKRRRPVPA